MERKILEFLKDKKSAMSAKNIFDSMKQIEADDIYSLMNRIKEIKKYDNLSEEDLKEIDDLNSVIESKRETFEYDFQRDDSYNRFLDVIKKMVEKAMLHFSSEKKYILFENCPDFRIGKLQITKDGFGFLMPIKDEEMKTTDFEDLFIPKKYIGLALDGDIVVAKTTEDPKRPGKLMGMIIKVYEQKRDLKNIVGSIKSDGKGLYFEPSKAMDIILTIDEESLKKCVEGEIVVVSVLSNLGKNRYTAAVTRHVCHKDDAQADILEIAAKHEIYPEFTKDAMDQAESLPVEISGELLEKEMKVREDLTDKMIFTIDGADTKDIDDAISLEVKDGYFMLGVHIADVAHYVTPGSPLDEDARRRGTSSYLAYSVIPMLPHKLSNGICSLNPDVIRCALSCEMKIDHRGKVVDSRIFPSLIKSNKKMTYDNVNKIIEDNEIPEGYEPFADTLKAMQELAHIIRNERTNRGASDFDIPEAKIICDESGKPTEIKKRDRGEGERLIEDFMIVANETVARTLTRDGFPSIYRVHGTPSEEKVQEFIKFCEITGHPIKGKFAGELKPNQYQSLLKQINVEGPAANIYKSLAVRSMPKAFYGTENIGHFGLAVISPFNAYTHFTSPIRRYPDTTIHRLIWTYYKWEKEPNGQLREMVENRLSNETELQRIANDLYVVGKTSSERENEAVKAEREVDAMKMAEYMEDHIGEEFDAVIVETKKYGLFVQLDNLVEGLIPKEELDGRFDFNEDLQCLMDPKSKKTYRVGDALRVKCIAASKLESKIDFAEVRERKLDDKDTREYDEEEPVKKLLKFGKRKR